MLPIKGALRGRIGLIWLEQAGPYAVVTNKELHDNGKARKYAVANPRERLVTSVHSSPDEALAIARALSANEANKRHRTA